MLEAIALFLWVFVIGVLLHQQITLVSLIAILAASITAVVLTARLARLGRGTFTSMPRLAAAQVMRIGAAYADTIAIVRAAVAADVKLKPALVRVRTRASDPLQLATLANLVGAAPGAVVISSDQEGLLVHVNQEGDERFAKLSAWEALAGVTKERRR